MPDTVGYNLPQQFGTTLHSLMERIPNADKAVFSVHCHNDLGLAVGNSLAAVLNGARQVECTINGLGERAGNASLEEIVMAIHTRADFFADVVDRSQLIRINTKEIYRTSQMVSRLTGFVIQPNKAIVGHNAFAHESGVHVDGLLKEKSTYEIMTPETIGLSGSRMVLGRHTGRHGFVDHCKQMGFQLSDEDTEKAYQRAKMEVHAAMIDCIDQNLGRVIQFTLAVERDDPGLLDGATADRVARHRRRHGPRLDGAGRDHHHDARAQCEGLNQVG